MSIVSLIVLWPARSLATFMWTPAAVVGEGWANGEPVHFLPDQVAAQGVDGESRQGHSGQDFAEPETAAKPEQNGNVERRTFGRVQHTRGLHNPEMLRPNVYCLFTARHIINSIIGEPSDD